MQNTNIFTYRGAEFTNNLKLCYNNCFFFQLNSPRCIIDLSCAYLSLVMMTSNYSFKVHVRVATTTHLGCYIQVIPLDAFDSRLNLGLMNRPGYSVSQATDLFITIFSFCYNCCSTACSSCCFWTQVCIWGAYSTLVTQQLKPLEHNLFHNRHSSTKILPQT